MLITGSKEQLLAQLKQALTGMPSQSKRRPGRPKLTHPQANNSAMQQLSTAAGGVDATHSKHLSISEDSILSDCASLSSIKDMLQSDAEEDFFHTNQSTNQRDALSLVQRSTIKDIVWQSLHGPNHTEVNYQLCCQHGWFSGGVVLTSTGLSNLAGTRRKSPATSSICAFV